jgi:RNA polymerase sigma-70 factor, ECF subfamily
LDRAREAELARALAAREPQAFEQFVEHFRSKIFHYCWLVCGQRDDAEEVAQETLLKVFASFEQLREPERLRAWVFRIARNACLMRRRMGAFAPQHTLSVEELPPGFEIEDAAISPDDQLQGAELRALLDRVIAELPAPYRPVVLLRDLEELSTEETAELLDLTPDVVKTRLHRARIAMRQKLDCYLNNRCIDVEPIASPSPLSEVAWDDLRQAWQAPHSAGTKAEK